MRHIWIITFLGKPIGWSVRCTSCDRLLDARWFNGWVWYDGKKIAKKTLVEQFMHSQLTEGGCDGCVHPHR